MSHPAQTGALDHPCLDVLAQQMQTLEDLVGRSPNQLPQGEGEASEYFRKLVNGDFLQQVLRMM